VARVHLLPDDVRDKKRRARAPLSYL